MNGIDRDHPSEDALERFLLDQSDEDELEVVETHILACDMCINRLETLDVNIADMKLALQGYRQAEREVELAAPARPAVAAPDLAKQDLAASIAIPTSPFGVTFRRWFTLPRLSFTAASLAACALVFTLVSVPHDVNLTAFRGSETNLVLQWVPLNLHLNARQLTAGPATVELVDFQGEEIWRGPAVIQNDRIDIRVPRLHTAGQYFVRIYSAQPDSPTLLREYSMQTKPLF